MSRPATAGITFPVHDVKPAAAPLPTCKPKEALTALAGDGVEACHDYTADCVRHVRQHPLFAAAHFAFSDHRPLVLAPDTVWAAVLQGAAEHVKNNPERLRGRLVAHAGKQTLVVTRDDFAKGSPENPWAEVVAGFSRQVRGAVGPRYDQLTPDFSTTGPAERTACEVALLDAFRPYFELVFRCICGIPEVTLEGTPADWDRLRDKFGALDDLELDWWLPHVRRIADQFRRAARGDIDRRFWRDIYKQEQAYGTTNVNGWLVQLVPYLKNWQTGNFTVRNPLLSDANAQVTTSALPGGLSRAPFRAEWPTGTTAMEFLGGFVGVTQDPQTLALRPRLGWGVRKGEAFDQLLLKLAAFSPAPPLEPAELDKTIGRLGGRFGERPGDLLQFYKHYNGVTLFGGAARVRPLAEVEAVRDVGARVCDFADGSSAVVELSARSRRSGGGLAWRVFHCPAGAAELTGREPVLANSFTELLEKLLTAEGRVEAITP